MLRPYARPTALVANPNQRYTYLPLAVNARHATRMRNRWLASHTPSDASSGFSSDSAVAFFTTWSNSFTEIFTRAVTRVFEVWCRLGADRQHTHLLPAMWGSSWEPDYAKSWLSPYTAHEVHPMALTPPRELVEPIWRALATKEQYALYLNLSAQMFARRRQPRCLLGHQQLVACVHHVDEAVQNTPYATGALSAHWSATSLGSLFTAPSVHGRRYSRSRYTTVESPRYVSTASESCCNLLTLPVAAAELHHFWRCSVPRALDPVELLRNAITPCLAVPRNPSRRQMSAEVLVSLDFGLAQYRPMDPTRLAGADSWNLIGSH